MNTHGQILLYRAFRKSYGDSGKDYFETTRPMLLETAPEHPRFVAYNMLPNAGYMVKTTLLRSGHSFETVVFEIASFKSVKRVNMTNRDSALEAHQNMVDKYTFIHWTG